MFVFLHYSQWARAVISRTDRDTSQVLVSHPVLEVIHVVLCITVLWTMEAKACLLVVGLDTSYGPC